MLIGVCLFVLVLDQVLKNWLVAQHSSLVVINSNLAFGVGNQWGLGLGIGLLVIIFVLERSRSYNVWIVLLIAILSNIIDRLHFGGVVDYINLVRLHFNLADGLVCFCLGLLTWRALTSSGGIIYGTPMK